METEKKLPPEFLMTAMEMAERVAECSVAERPTLAKDLGAQLEQIMNQIERAFAADETQGVETPRVKTPRVVAGLLHRSRYYRKALHDLSGR
jgi:hypothetical protein